MPPKDNPPLNLAHTHTADTDPRLAIVRDFAERMDEAGISYCHWKSNESLDVAVGGDTDLDVLFDERDTQRVEALLARIGFLKSRAIWLRRYPGVEDFIGIDPTTGKLVHLQAHYQLVLGETSVKTYRLPWEAEVLSTRVLDQTNHIYRAAPAWEYLLLVIREAIKLKPSAQALASVGHSMKDAAKSARELAWLRERVDPDDVLKLAREHIGEAASTSLRALLEKGWNIPDIRAFRAIAKPAIRHHRRFGPFRALAENWSRGLGTLAARIARKLGIRRFPLRRTFPDTGIIIAILGADGSGKSTLHKLLSQEFAKKFDVWPLYMGSGIGDVSLLRWPLLRLKQALRRDGIPGVAPSAATPKAGRPRGFSATTFNTLWCLSLALEKRIRLGHAARAKKRGMIVICDRYPQTKIRGYNDGPLLPKGKFKSTFMKALVRWEHASYKRAITCPPDLAIRLIGDPAIMAERRPEMTEEWIARKQSGVIDFEFSQSTRVVDIDPAKPLADIFATAMSAAADRLRSQ